MKYSALIVRIILAIIRTIKSKRMITHSKNKLHVILLIIIGIL